MNLLKLLCMMWTRLIKIGVDFRIGRSVSLFSEQALLIGFDTLVLLSYVQLIVFLWSYNVLFFKLHCSFFNYCCESAVVQA